MQRLSMGFLNRPVMKRFARHGEGVRYTVLLLLFSLFLSGCAGWLTTRPAGPWHEAYEPISDPASGAFLTNCFERAQARFGEPAIPVKKILLRRSRKTREASRYRIGEDFSLTECVDPTNGLFVIYIGVDPDHSNYHALLAHESVHLLNPHVTDWYMEGMATVFSEQVCDELGQAWGDWKRHFMKSRRDPYALSYRMMLELQEAFPWEYPQMIQYAARNDSESNGWLQIDIDQWIDMLPEARRGEAREIIVPYGAILKKHTGEMYGFREPSS